jgi:chromosome segregation ATPase
LRIKPNTSFPLELPFVVSESLEKQEAVNVQHELSGHSDAIVIVEDQESKDGNLLLLDVMGKMLGRFAGSLLQLDPVAATKIASRSTLAI